nr:MAG TPA: 43 kDa tail protein [Caudoviricetes sp.]
MAKNKIVYASYIFSDDDETLRNGNEYKITSLIADELQADTIELDVKCSDKNIVVFTENAPLQYYRENILRSTYYVQSIKRIGGDKYTISADSAMGLLMKRLHVGGIYTGQAVKEVVNEICGNIPILVKTVFADTKLYGWLPYCKPPKSSARNNLAQVLYAIGAALTTDNNGVLRVEPLWDGTSSSIGETRLYFDGSVETEKPISAVTVTEHQYIAGTDEKELFSGTSQQGDIITFSEPMHSLTATGFTILESGANYAKISSGSGSLKGKTYIHNTRLVTQTVTENAAENVKSVTDATLVSLVNSSAVAKRLADYYKCRETITNGIVSGQEKPGHVVSVYHPYDKKMVSACIVSLDTTMSGTLKSEMAALVGFLPPQPESSEYFDERVILTGSGEWTVPEGVTSYTRVLIGGGQGGKHGGKGEDGKQRTASWTERVLGTLTYNWSGYLPGAISKGGVGGEGGVGGKVLVETVNDATPGESIAYSCGAAGAGATTDGAEGANGTATTMGGSSSDSGSSSNIGYTDPVTGEVFAAKGDTGIAGGDSGGCSDVSAYPNPTVSGCLYVGQGIAEATDVVDEDGKVWKSGAWPRYNSTQQIYGTGNSASADGDLSHGAVECSASCSGPSGAAVGANGSDGSATNCKATAGKEGNPTYMYAYASPGYPVNGANAATAPKKPSAYGKGGRGGHGGGAGGCGGYSATGKTTSSTMTQKTQANTRGVGTG